MNKSTGWPRDIGRGGIAAAASPTSKWGPTPMERAKPPAKQSRESQEEAAKLGALEDPAVAWLELVEAYHCRDAQIRMRQVNLQLARAKASQWCWELFDQIYPDEEEDTDKFFQSDEGNLDPGYDDPDCAQSKKPKPDAATQMDDDDLM